MSAKSVVIGGLVSLAAFVSMAPAAPPALPAVIWIGYGTGKSAEAQFSDADGSGGRINLFRNNGQTFLYYEIWGNDPASEVCNAIIDQFGNIITICSFTRTFYDSGWGTIPSTDVQLVGADTHLLTTTGANFTANRCTTDTSGMTPVTTCASVSALHFDLTWTPNGQSSTDTLSRNRQTIGAFTFDSAGGSHAVSAFVKGSVLGHTLVRAPGKLADTEGASVARN